MSRFPFFLVLVGAVLLAAPVDATAQASRDCPPSYPGSPAPVELRIGDLVLRAQVSAESVADTAGTRVTARLVGCERDRVIEGADGEAADPLAGGPLLRLLSDLRLSFELAETGGGECVRARFEVSEPVSGVEAGPGGKPLDLELCGLPGLSVGTASPRDEP